MTLASITSAWGGRNALTMWSWVIAVPLGVMSGWFFGVRFGISSPKWFVTLLVIHASLAVPFWLLHVGLVRASTQRLRPVLGLTAFALLGFLRLLIMMLVARDQGAPLTARFMVEYLPHGILSGVVVLGIVAVVVDGSRKHAESMGQLAALDANLERLRALDEASIQEAEAVAADAVRQSLDDEIRQMRTSAELTAASAAASLRELAQNVVRPASHQLFDDESSMQLPQQPPAQIDQKEQERAVLSLMRPAAPTIPVVLVMLMGLPSEAVEGVGGAVFAILNTLLAGAVIWLVLWLLATLWPQGPMTRLRLVVLILGSALAGGSGALAMAISSQVFVGTFRGLWVGPLLVAVTAVGVSLLSAIGTQRQVLEERLTVSVVRDAEITLRVRDQSCRARRRIAEFLHSEVQAELIASSLVLSQISQAPSDVQREHVIGELDRIASKVCREWKEGDDEALQAKERISELISLWSGVLEVGVEVGEETWHFLDSDAHARSAIEHVVSEGLTNAVRHAGTRQASIVMRNERDAVVVRVGSSGTVRPAARAGLGSRFLNDHARTWELLERDGHVELIAEIPVLMR